MTPTLHELERRFHALIAQPQPVGEAAPRLGIPDIEDWLWGGRAGAVARLDLYARMHFGRLRDSLREDFPTIAALVGAADFERLAAAYVLSHPSRDASLARFGRRLPAFARVHPVGRSRRDLSDIAELEWTRLTSFDAPERRALTREGLMAIAQDGFDRRVPKADPSVHLLRVHFDADAVWLAVDRGEPPPDAAPNAGSLLIWRRDHVVRHRRVDAREAAAVKALLAGTTFSVICEALGSYEVSVAIGAKRAWESLEQWVVDGLLDEVAK